MISPDPVTLSLVHLTTPPWPYGPPWTTCLVAMATQPLGLHLLGSSPGARSVGRTVSVYHTLPYSAILCHTILHFGHTLHREEGSGHAATVELSPRQKLAVNNEICALYRSHRLSWSSNYVTTCLANGCQHLTI